MVDSWVVGTRCLFFGGEEGSLRRRVDEERTFTKGELGGESTGTTTGVVESVEPDDEDDGWGFPSSVEVGTSIRFSYDSFETR